MKLLASLILLAGLAGFNLQAHLRLDGTQLDLRGTDVSDSDLAGLQTEAMAPVRTVLLASTAISDQGLSHLRGLQVEELDLFRTSVSNEGMAHLAGLPLRRLTLTGTAIDDDGLAKLADLPLVHLRLANTTVGDAGLEHLSRMRLMRLDLARTRLTDDGLEALLTIQSLQMIDVSFTDTTGEGLKKLAALPALNTLVAIEIPISDAQRAFIMEARPGLMLLTDMPTR
jgi:hypothetical protein